LKLAALSTELIAFAGLPRRVRAFYTRAVLSALRTRDRFALIASARPRELRALLEAARGAKHVVELGTGTAWTAISLALADEGRSVVSFDPWHFDQRERYLGMVKPEVRERIELRRERGSADPVDALFIDIGDHARDLTVAAYEAWEGAVVPGGVIAFHDYSDAWPGVREAVAALGLTGTLTGVLFVVRKQTRA
jgi:predicted O-methyltransferase YrrM